MGDSRKQSKAAKSRRVAAAATHHSQLPIVRITIDDAVLVLGVLELVGPELDPDSDLAVLVGRAAARVSARLGGLAEALSPPVPGTSNGAGPGPAAAGPPRGERRTPA